MHERCGTCRYRSSTPGSGDCDYAIIMRHSRACPPGDACTRYIEGPRLTANRPELGAGPREDMDAYEAIIRWRLREVHRNHGNK